MYLYVDGNTRKDLNIFDSRGDQYSMFDFFNRTQTVRGENKLNEMLKRPLSDLSMILERRDTIAFFQQNNLCFIVDKQDIDFVEHYMNLSGVARSFSRYNAVIKFIDNKIKAKSSYYIVERGIEYLIYILRGFHEFVLGLEKLACPPYLQRQNQQLLALFEREEYAELKDMYTLEKLSPILIEKYDYLFRNRDRVVIETILQIIYEYDVFQSVAKVAAEKRLSYSEILPPDQQVLHIEGMFHPFIEKPVSNNISMNASLNLCFITGPNMAGKSTFLRSVGLACYLAHVGFPVPAKRMRMNLLTGISTSINIVDDIELGYSHFYSEVLRVKEVAELMKTHRNMLIIFDELFRGTNVKDALDASVGVVNALAGNRNCFYLISSHIIEVAEEVNKNRNVFFASFDVDMSTGDFPTYTYQLKEGITASRIGMHILRREQVIETILESYPKVDSTD